MNTFFIILILLVVYLLSVKISLRYYVLYEKATRDTLIRFSKNVCYFPFLNTVFSIICALFRILGLFN